MRVEYIAGKRAGTSADVDEPTAQMLVDSGRARVVAGSATASPTEGEPEKRVKRKYTRRTPASTPSTSSTPEGTE